MKTASHQPGPPQAIDTFELVGILWRQRFTWLVIFAALFVSTFILIWVMPPVYESEGVLEIGSLRPRQPIEPPGVVVARVKAAEAVWVEDRPYPRISEVDYLDRDASPQLIRVIAEGRTPVEAQQQTDRVLHSIADQHRRISRRRLEQEAEQLEMLQTRVKMLQTNIDALDRQLQAARTEGEQNAVWPLMVKRADSERLLVEAQEPLRVSRLLLDTIERHPTEIRHPASRPEKPSQPRVALILLLGFMAAVLAATTTCLGKAFLTGQR